MLVVKLSVLLINNYEWWQARVDTPFGAPKYHKRYNSKCVPVQPMTNGAGKEFYGVTVFWHQTREISFSTRRSTALTLKQVHALA